MRIRRQSFILLTSLFLLTACSDNGNQTSGASGGGGGAGGDAGAGGAGGAGGGTSIQIEKPENAIEGQYIFVLDDAAVMPDMVQTVAETLLAPHGGMLLQVYDGGFTGFSANGLDDSKALAMAKDPRIKGIAQDCLITLDDVQTNATWGLDRIDQQALPLDGSYTYWPTGKGVNAYIVDSGVRHTHNEFTGRISTATAKNFVTNTATLNDCNGHGTHVAGTVGGSTFGVAKGVTLHSIRVADCQGVSNAGTFIKAIDWITKNHKKPAVVNMSLGSAALSLIDDAVRKSIAAGVIYVAAAGNSNSDACNVSPARMPEILTVGATDKNDTRASFSNFGSCLDLFAPGVAIKSAYNAFDTFDTVKSGTSMAAPHVTGAVALYLESHPMAKQAEVNQAVLDGAILDVVKDPAGSPNKLLSMRFTSPKTGFVNSQSWDNGYFTDGGLWLNANQGPTIQYADINGDKKMDVCGRAANGIVCELSNGNGFGAAQVWEPGYGNMNGWDVTDYMYGSIRFPDLNGDGKADVCGRGPGGVYCGLSNGTKFSPSPTTWDNPPHFTDVNGWANPTFWTTMQFPDINGDGKADICGRQAAGVVCALSTGTAFGPVELWDSGFADGSGWAGSPNLYGTIRFPDLNGDGKADVCGRSNSGLSCSLSDGTKFVPGGLWDSYFADAGQWNQDTYWRTIQFADLNGDKKADVCGRAENGIVCELSTGSKFGAPTLWDPSFTNAVGWGGVPAHWATIRLADINGDGKADVCGRAASGIVCSLSTGTTFGFSASWDSTYSDVNGWATQDYYWGTIRFPDLNGDGKADVCGRSVNGILCSTAP